jgi:hypothetical protein
MRLEPNEIVPDEGVSSPATILSSVLLPQPEGPSKTQNSPSATSKEIFSSTALLPKDLETPCTVSPLIGHLLYSKRPSAVSQSEDGSLFMLIADG